MKIKIWKLIGSLFVTLLGITLVIWHQRLTGGKFIIADGPFIDQIDWSPTWFIGASGVVLAFFGACRFGALAMYFTPKLKQSDFARDKWIDSDPNREYRIKHLKDQISKS